MIIMHNHLPHLQPAGSAHHLHSHSRRLSAAAVVQHLPHPSHWTYPTIHHIQSLHPLQHILEKHYAAHAGHWIADHAAITAVLLACLLCGILYAVLSAPQINDYTTGSWGLFG